MLKRILAAGLAIMLIMTFSSCRLLKSFDNEIDDLGMNDRVELDEDLHNTIEYIDSDISENNDIRYQDSLYYSDQLGIFTVTDYFEQPNENDVLLGWTGLRYGRAFFYYSDTVDSPVFIYESTTPTVYFNKEYDYMSDTFAIAGTDIEIVFSDMVIDFSEYVATTSYSGIETNLYSQKCSRIHLLVELSQENGNWYIHASNYKWKPIPIGLMF